MLYIISPTWPMFRVIGVSFMGLRPTRNLRKVRRAGVLARRSTGLMVRGTHPAEDFEP
jgi:hypothetical protein